MYLYLFPENNRDLFKTSEVTFCKHYLYIGMSHKNIQK